MSIQTLRSHKHPLISEDHMFSAFVDSGLVTDLACFYDRERRRFTSVISLGPRTCGYKRITHGGATLGQPHGSAVVSIVDFTLRCWHSSAGE